MKIKKEKICFERSFLKFPKKKSAYLLKSKKLNMADNKGGIDFCYFE